MWDVGCGCYPLVCHRKEFPLPQDRDLILAEEERAWDHGRETLTSLGVTEWQTFDDRKRDGLAYYAAELAVVPQ